MKINWFTVAAQVINFLVLVWLLKRFLYKPILSAIDEREKMIADQIKDADDKKALAIKEQDEFKKKNDDFDQQKKGLMDQAVVDMNAEKAKLLDAAKNDADIMRTNLEKATKEDQENKNVELAATTQKQVFAIARKALADIASLSLEAQSVNAFVKRLNESNDEEKKQFIDAFRSNDNAILIRTAFDLPDKQKGEINAAIDSILKAKTQPQYKTTPALISGIELTTNGYKLAWSFSEYINSIEKKY